MGVGSGGVLVAEADSVLDLFLLVSRYSNPHSDTAGMRREHTLLTTESFSRRLLSKPA